MTTPNTPNNQAYTTMPDRTHRVSNETVTNSDGTQSTTPDPFDAPQAMQYIVILTIGYMIARGLAKSGSRNSHVE